LPTGTLSNLCALMSHCQRGEEYIAGQMAHTYRWEGGGAAVLGSIQPQPLNNQRDGSLALADIEAAIKADDPHFAVSRLLCLENTIAGQVLTLDYQRAATALAKRKGLSTHLDGARLFNAAVAMGGDARANARHIADLYDSVSVCFSKGLGAPVGSALVGSKALIAKARRARKMTGGAMRQAGLLAAAASHALEHHVDRLAEDHAHARQLAEGLAGLAGVTVVPPQTNMVFLDLAPDREAEAVIKAAAERGLRCYDLYRVRLRLVPHLGVTPDDIARAVEILRDILR
jgi:threonine aldolase